MRDWNSTFSDWAMPPSQTEQRKCENAIKAIKDAISSSKELQQRDVLVFLQGSYCNRVNVRQDSDVDIGVACRTTFFADYPNGLTHEDFGNHPSDYTFSRFKEEVKAALISKFGASSVYTGSKAFDIKENTYRVEADVAPFFQYRKYDLNGLFMEGVELRTTLNHRIINWPEQHYNNGVHKNNLTQRKFKGITRILKKLCLEMEREGKTEPSCIPGFLCECLAWNIPDKIYSKGSYYDILRDGLLFLYNSLNDQQNVTFKEVNGIKPLFGGGQKWTIDQAKSFIESAWEYVG